MKTADLPVLRGFDRSTQRRVWAVLSRSRTAKNGFPTFHLVSFDYRAGAWRCPCEARSACVHMAAASAASKAEKEREFAADEARRAGAISARRTPRPAVVLTERVMEAW